MSPRLWVKNNDTHLGLYHINPLSFPVPGAGARGFHPPAQGQVGQGCRRVRGQAHSPAELQAGLWESTGTVTGSSPWHACHSAVTRKIAESTNENMKTFHGNVQLDSTGPPQFLYLGCNSHNG